MNFRPDWNDWAAGSFKRWECNSSEPADLDGSELAKDFVYSLSCFFVVNSAVVKVRRIAIL